MGKVGAEVGEWGKVLMREYEKICLYIANEIILCCESALEKLLFSQCVFSLSVTHLKLLFVVLFKLLA